MSRRKVLVTEGHPPSEGQWTHEEHRQALEELTLFKAAQKAVDSVLGEGTYVRVNGFDPSKGETHK